MDKSYVSMEQKQCIACGEIYDTNNLLMDMRLRDSMDRHTVTGLGLCLEHDKSADGFVCLIEIDESKSAFEGDGSNLKSKDAYRTGRVAHMKEEAFRNVFDVEPVPAQFLSIETFEQLIAMTAASENGD